MGICVCACVREKDQWECKIRARHPNFLQGGRILFPAFYTILWRGNKLFDNELRLLQIAKNLGETFAFFKL